MMQLSLQNSPKWQEVVSLARQKLQRTVIDNPFIPLTPYPVQAAFLTLPAREILYGGAAGGAKSVALLMAALQYATEPGYAALILRRSYADLYKPKALIPLSHEWLQGTKAKWDGQKHQWTFPSGATLSFGYLATENDKYQFQGAAYNFCGFDELTQFTETQYRYLFSRTRRLAESTTPIRIRATSNPGGVGHDWVKQRFLTENGGEDRVFIPASLADNLLLDRADYESSLTELDPVTRAQLLNGDWDIRPEGNLFKREWFDTVEDVPPLKRIVRYWDFAATEAEEGKDPDWTAGVKMGMSQHGICYVLDVKHLQGTPLEVKRIVCSTAAKDGRECGVYLEQEGGSSGKIVVDTVRREWLPGYEVRGVRSTGDKVTRARPFSAICEAGDVKLFRGGWIRKFLDELCGFPQKGMHDDQVDAAAGAHRALTQDQDDWTEEDLMGLAGASLNEPKAPTYRELLLERIKH